MTAGPAELERPLHVLVYGDVDMNLIDGSSVWLQSVVSALQRCPRVRVTVQLKRAIERDVLTAPLERLEGVELIPPPEGTGIRLRPEAVPDLLAAHDERLGRVDAVLLRGFSVCRLVARDGRLDGRLWCYITDFPQRRDRLSEDKVTGLSLISAASRMLLCQTPEMQTFLELEVPGVAGRTALLPPLVPDMPDAPPPDLGRRSGARLIYAGKFSRLWRTEELVRAIPALRSEFPAAELVVAGDKIHHEAADPEFQERMRTALETTPGVSWRGAMSRDDVQELIATADFGVSLRDPSLDASLELSTKVLEYGRAGVPPVLSRTPMHERLLGAGYPLFVGPGEDLADRLREAIASPERYAAAALAAWDAARRHTFSAIGERLQALLDRALPAPAVAVREPRRVLVAGHDLKFAHELIDHLGSLRDVEVRVERWLGLDRHDTEESEANLRWADAVLAEWCLANAVFYGSRRREGQRVTTRFHLVERETEYPGRLRPEWIDHIGFVGPHVLREMRDRLAVPPERLSVVPNLVPNGRLQRPKLRGAAHTLGIVGISPRRKRLDWALDLLRLLRTEDDRFTLRVKGKLPLEHAWVWRQEPEREYYLALGRRIAADPLLRESVVFEPFDPLMGEWYRRIGFILSPSDFESHHLGLAEGIASGAVPVIRDWAGAAEIYPEERTVTSVEEAASLVRDAISAGEPQRRQRAALESLPDAQALAAAREWERILLAPQPT